MKNKPCPFCGAELVQENRLNPFAKRDDLPFRTFYVHPNNGCFLSNEPFREEKLEQWNTRTGENQNDT